MMLLEKMMEKNEHAFLDHIPVQSLSLRLARSTIKMRHDPDWRIDKLNPVHDLFVCLSGSGVYQFGDDPTQIPIRAGEAMLVPAYTRFRGANTGNSTYIGIAQHFSLDMFGRGDLIPQMDLKRVVSLPNWPVLEPLVHHYHDIAPHGRTTLAQHHQFMVVLLAYLEEAFTGWKAEQESPDSQDRLSVQIMLAASRLSSDPLGGVFDELLTDVPYNHDYFRRAFKDRIGYTPQKFRELKRIEFAADRLGMGLTVKAVAAELGYDDPYYFSRIFKRYLGESPSIYKERPGVGATEAPAATDP